MKYGLKKDLHFHSQDWIVAVDESMSSHLIHSPNKGGYLPFQPIGNKISEIGEGWREKVQRCRLKRRCSEGWRR